MMTTLWKKSLVLSLAIIMVAAPLLAQQEMNEYLQGKKDGELEAKGNGMWFLAGCCLGGVGIIIAYVVEPSVPTDHLIGKSPEYIQGYTEGYINKAKSKNGMNAIYGCVTTTVVYGVLYFAVIASAISD
jgi:hypothetical protein